MKNKTDRRTAPVFIAVLALTSALLASLTALPAGHGMSSAAGVQAPLRAEAGVAKEKKLVLDLLSTPEALEKYGRISDAVWGFAELGLQETRSAGLLADTLEAAGFKVERGLAGMPTCFVATYGAGRPVIGLLGEYDALPMLSQKGRKPEKDPLVEGAPGHGCGHNMMGTAAAAAAIAVKEAMVRFKLPGTIKVLGSPGEEILASRPYMIRAGLFEGVDAVIDNHASSGFGTSYGVEGNAVFSTVFTFRGRTAHAAGAPWMGRSALDAVEIMNVAANYLREHLPLTQRMHYVILEGGEAPNVVPDKASVWYYVRNTDELVEDMHRRVTDCARAGALASGTELVQVRVLSAVHQRHANKAAAELFQKNIELVGMPAWSEEDNAFARELQKSLGRKETGMPLEVDKLRAPTDKFTGGGSSDVGDVTLVAPTATIVFPGIVPGAIGHHWSTVASTFGPAAHKGLLAGAKAIAASAVDLLTKPAALAELRREFEAYSKEHPYKPFIPEDARPPLDLNKAAMEKWRVLLEASK